MELNLNNVTPTKDLDRHSPVTEYYFWRFYLTMLNFKKDRMTGREIDLMAFALSEDYYKPPFRRGNSTKAAKLLDVSNVQVSHIKNFLVEKGFLEYVDGSLYPCQEFRPLQKYIKFKLAAEDLDIKLAFPFKLKKAWSQ